MVMTPDEIKAQQELIRKRYASDRVSRETAIKDIAEELGRVMRRHLDEGTKCCINCEHWRATELCVLAGKRPPAHIIAFGCEQYQDNIPF
jgi:hypothetical protein